MAISDELMRDCDCDLQAMPPPPSTPPPPPWQPGSSGQSVVAKLNQQWLRGGKEDWHKGMALSEAGVLVRQFDTLSDHDSGRAWLPCPKNLWCAQYHAQWPASIINKDIKHMYYHDRGGMVLNPEKIELFCIYPSK